MPFGPFDCGQSNYEMANMFGLIKYQQMPSMVDWWWWSLPMGLVNGAKSSI